MKMFSRVIVAAGLSLLLGSAAAAQQAGWYGGLSAGQGNIDLTTRDWDDGTLTNTVLDHDGVAYKVIAGYRFTRYLSLEGSYVHFSDGKFSGVEPLTTSTVWKIGQVFGEARAKGVSLQGLLAWPFAKERFAMFAKGGLFFWNTAMVSRPTIAGGTLALGDERVIYDDGVSWIFGAGAEMRLYDNWHIRLEWEHSMMGFSGTVDRNVDFPSLGVTLDL